MSHVHVSVNNMSAVYFNNERRYNYTTPKTFLELIALYAKLLDEKTSNLKMMIVRLENGLEKLASCAGDVAVLKVSIIVYADFRLLGNINKKNTHNCISRLFFKQVTLGQQEVILKVKNKAAEELIEVVGAESEKVAKEKAYGKIITVYI